MATLSVKWNIGQCDICIASWEAKGVCVVDQYTVDEWKAELAKLCKGEI